jgi:NADH-quinone oxidoreductase subunit F
MDRSLLEGNPHAIIEGMMIGGVAIGATRGLIYARTEYPLAIKHALIALRQARELGLLGHNLLGTGLDFDIDIVRGAGAFVCGEETALIRSIEGYMGEPKQRPPYPIAKGIDGNPTCINNVETLANVPMIMSKGAEEYAEVGVERNRGTKIFSLVGKIKNTGLVEVPLGMKIKDVVYEIGGGAPGDAKVKAVQTGGPSGGCIPAERFDLSISYDSLAEAGSIMGSGGMIVMDENTCMVDVAKYFVGFLKEESCGKCFTCRKGTQRMYEILENISKGKGDLDQIDLLEELAHVVRDTTMCGLGQTSPNPVISALRYYRDELVEHLRDKRCRAGVCVDLVGSPCQDACPLDTEAWRYVAHIARGEYEAAYQAIREANPFPSVCARVCNHPCEARCKAGRTGGRPVAIRHLKRFVTDQVDPSVYQPSRQARPADQVKKMAVVGSGPAGLTAAHHLSLRGHEVTVFEAESKPGGMLINGIPAYRLPREILSKEIESLVDENVSLVTGKALGRDLTIDELFSEGFDAVFLAMGAHKSRMLDIEGEELENVYPAIQFLKAHNLHGASLARGRVGVIGGGDSAVDAARVALRQEGVQSVTIMYRRTRPEMPALSEEVEEAVREGVKLRTLVTPVKIHSRDGLLTGVELLRNKQGEYDSSGRKRPVPVEGTEHVVPLDVLIVTIGDQPDVGYISSMGIEVNDWGAIQTDPDTLACNRPGVFAGGDVVTGPNTVVQAIAAGKKAAVMMDRYVCGEQLVRPAEIRLPRTFVAPPAKAEDVSDVDRVAPPSLGLDDRKRSFAEVELTLTEEQARLEALRCLRCDLDFTDVEAKQPESQSGRAATESNTS